MSAEEAKSKYPNLWRVACELARCEHPYKVADALLAILAANPDMLQITLGEVMQDGQ